MLKSEQKVAIVTGASSGIGRETVLQLAKRGYQVHELAAWRQ
jgi:NAD(P)-dependent dehydrogenase (short-subunit alcohol dehydrogenase family)